MKILNFIVLLLFGCSIPITPHQGITPQAVTKCIRCHSHAGPGIEFNATTTPALAGLIVQDVTSGRMPPWVPSNESPQYVENFSLSEAERIEVLRWAMNGATFDLQPSATQTSYGLPDLIVTMPMAYVPPPPPAVDEYRCFAIPAAGAIRAYRWKIGTPRAIHHETALVLTAAGMASARTRESADGRPGFSCLPLPTEIEAVANLGAAGINPVEITSFPDGIGAVIPLGGGVLIQMHYTGPGAQGDVSSLEVWSPKGNVQQLQLHALWAPVELPCPTGVSSDPRNRCSREYAVSMSTIQTPNEVRAQADYLLTQCGKSLSAQQTQTAYVPTVPEHFYVPTDCIGTLPYDGTIWQVHGHMHTQGVSFRAELAVNGVWQPLIVIDKWRWVWESAYTLSKPIKFNKGQQLRVSCVHDNGSEIQPSAIDGYPGYDGRAQLPLQDTSYKIMGFARSNEMCEIFLGVTVNQ